MKIFIQIALQLAVALIIIAIGENTYGKHNHIVWYLSGALSVFVVMIYREMVKK